VVTHSLVDLAIELWLFYPNKVPYWTTGGFSFEQHRQYGVQTCLKYCHLMLDTDSNRIARLIGAAFAFVVIYYVMYRYTLCSCFLTISLRFAIAVATDLATDSTLTSTF
jgi:hypothetical protein